MVEGYKNAQYEKGSKECEKIWLKGATTTKRVQRGNNSNEKRQQGNSCCSWFISFEYPVQFKGVWIKLNVYNIYLNS